MGKYKTKQEYEHAKREHAAVTPYGQAEAVTRSVLKRVETVIYFSPKAKRRMELYVEGVNGEISGLGTVKIVPGGFLVEEVFLLDQEVTGASTDLDRKAVGDFLEKVAITGEVEGVPVNPEEVRLWWHSHAAMSCFWSMTDEETAQTWMSGWRVAVVANHRGQVKARLDLDEPMPITLDNLTVSLYDPLRDVERGSVAEEIKAKVRQRAYTKLERFTEYDGYGGTYRSGLEEDGYVLNKATGVWTRTTNGGEHNEERVGDGGVHQTIGANPDERLTDGPSDAYRAWVGRELDRLRAAQDGGGGDFEC
jgi:hypothetical protein